MGSGGRPSELRTEAHLLRLLADARAPGFPRPLHFGQQSVDGKLCELLVEEQLGPSIEALWWAAAGGTRLSVGCALGVAAGALQRLQSLHRLGYVHNDVSPGNLCVGLDVDADGSGTAEVARQQIHLIDLGCCTRASTAAAPAVPTCEPVGTLMYASVAAHEGGVPTRPADDLESLGYMTAFLMRGDLPWEYERSERAVVRAKKQARTDDSMLFSGLPDEAAFAMRALLDPALRAGPGDVDHEAVLRSLRFAIAAYTRRQPPSGDELDVDAPPPLMDWERQGLRWTAAGVILDADGNVLHSPVATPCNANE